MVKVQCLMLPKVDSSQEIKDGMKIIYVIQFIHLENVQFRTPLPPKDVIPNNRSDEPKNDVEKFNSKDHQTVMKKSN